MKKSLSLMLALLLSLSLLTACGGSGGKAGLDPNVKITYDGITNYSDDMITRISSNNWGDICMIPTTIQLPDLGLYFHPLCQLSEIEADYNFVTSNRLLPVQGQAYHSLIDLTSYGHDIESSWLLDWGCSLLEDPALAEKIAAINSDLADSTLRTAFNGSLANECERGVVDTHRVWWVQAEALLGFVNEFQKHPGRLDCQDAAVSLWQYINEKMMDSRPGGEWFWRLEADGTPGKTQPVVEPWKCPYHNGRMCLELIRRNPDVYV